MAIDQDPVTLVAPALIIDETATEEQRTALQEFLLAASESNPAEILHGLELYDHHPQFTLDVLEIVKYVKRHPQGDQLIDAWSKVVDTGADRVSIFDDSTEDILAADDHHRNLIENFRAKPGEQERAAVRRNRFGNFAMRLASVGRARNLRPPAA